MLRTFDYPSISAFINSLSPSLKYSGVTGTTITISTISTLVLRVFGIDPLAFICLFLVFFFELVTGVTRARKQNEPFSSTKLSRFSFKLVYYLIIIAITYMMQRSFEDQGNDLASRIFHWMHVFFVVQIVLENIVSISENIAVITNRPKSHWIKKLQDKIESYFK